MDKKCKMLLECSPYDYKNYFYDLCLSSTNNHNEHNKDRKFQEIEEQSKEVSKNNKKHSYKEVCKRNKFFS